MNVIRANKKLLGMLLGVAFVLWHGQCDFRPFDQGCVREQPGR